MFCGWVSADLLLGSLERQEGEKESSQRRSEHRTEPWLSLMAALAVPCRPYPPPPARHFANSHHHFVPQRSVLAAASAPEGCCIISTCVSNANVSFAPLQEVLHHVCNSSSSAGLFHRCSCYQQPARAPHWCHLCHLSSQQVSVRGILALLDVPWVFKCSGNVISGSITSRVHSSNAGCSIGVCLPLLSATLGRSWQSLFFIVRATAGGVVLTTGFVHVLGDAVPVLTDPCLGLSSNYPWVSTTASFDLLLAICLMLACPCTGDSLDPRGMQAFVFATFSALLTFVLELYLHRHFHHRLARATSRLQDHSDICVEQGCSSAGRQLSGMYYCIQDHARPIDAPLSAATLRGPACWAPVEPNGLQSAANEQSCQLTTSDPAQAAVWSAAACPRSRPLP